MLAHILICFWAYVLWKTLAQMSLAAGLGAEPRRLFAELGELRMMDVILATSEGIELRRCCVSRPNEHQAIRLNRLRLRVSKSLETNQM